MKLSSIFHEVKSNLSYAFDEETLHIRLKTAINDVNKVTIRAVDPYSWRPTKEDSNKYEFNVDAIVEIAMKKEYSNELYDFWFGEIKGFDRKRIRYVFVVENDSERYVIGCHERVNLAEKPEQMNNTWNYYNFPFINHEDVYKAPSWVKDTVWYQIFPERFCRGSEDDADKFLPWGEVTGAEGTNDIYRRYGGDLQGIINMLDYIKDMGFTGIYFTPIFSSPSTHKYDTADYFKVDAAFGDNQKLGELVEAAHSRGIKIMLDAVFNHCGIDHPFWQDVLKNGVNSPYIDCFYIIDKDKPIVSDIKSRDELNYHTFAFSQHMPKWNTSNPIVKEHLLGVVKYWIEQYNIDGWRLDVSNEVSHSFWREFRDTVKSLNPDVYILGENWDNSYPWLAGDQFDAVMNYEFTNAVWNYLGTDTTCIKGKYTAVGYKNAMSTLLTDYPKHLLQNMFNLVDSHDTARLMTICGGNVKLAKLAYVLQMTFTGAPSVYYGGEVGIDGDEHNNRKCMIWDKSKQNSELQDTVRRLIEIRKQYESCKAVDIEWCYSDDTTNAIVIKKQTDRETLYVAVNNSAQSQVVDGDICHHEYTDLFSGERIAVGDGLELEPFGFKILLI